VLASDWGRYGGIKGQAKENFDSTSVTAPGLGTGMRTISSQTELVQSWGLAHSSPPLPWSNNFLLTKVKSGYPLKFQRFFYYWRNFAKKEKFKKNSKKK
jgi:hypothetical protein